MPIESPTKKPIWLNQNKNKTIKSLKFYFTKEKLYFRLVRIFLLHYIIIISGSSLFREIHCG